MFLPSQLGYVRLKNRHKLGLCQECQQEQARPFGDKEGGGFVFRYLE